MYAKKLYQVLSHHLSRNKYPEEIVFELSTRCNNKCVYCAHQRLLEDGKLEPQDMTIGLFKSTISRIKYIKPDLDYIVFSGLGEPTLHPNFDELIDFAKLHLPQTKLWLITNGITLLDHISIASSIDVLQVSLNVWGKESYKKINGSNNFDNVLDNILYFLEKSKRCKIHVQLLMANFNEGKYEHFKRYFSPYLRAGDTLVYEPIFNNVGFVNISKFVSEPKNKERNPCYHLFTSFNIMVDGECYPCCGGAMARFMLECGGLRLGNVMSGLGDLFESKKLMWLRKTHLNDNANLIAACRQCDVWMNSKNPFIFINGKWI